jgi:ribosome biogenesis protein Nip4
MKSFESFEAFCKLFNVHIENVLQENNNYLLLDTTLTETKNKTGRKLFSGGIYLGNKKRKQFFPSIALLDILAETYTQKIVVDKKTEWLFLCGRDIFAKSLNQDIPKGYSLIVNERGEVLGLGKKKKDLVENVLDRGNFLRREKK